MREERSCQSKERVENYPQSLKNEWKINGCRLLVSTQIPQFWDTERRGGGTVRERAELKQVGKGESRRRPVSTSEVGG